jgi:hypothetical protein
MRVDGRLVACHLYNSGAVPPCGSNINLSCWPPARRLKARFKRADTLWVDCSYENKRHENANRPRAELIAEILREYELNGDAMRYLDHTGQIAWKASPSMLQKLADAECEVKDDMGDFA